MVEEVDLTTTTVITKRSRKTKSDGNDTDGEASGKIGPKEGRWSKYAKRYNPKWEHLEILKHWLRRAPDNLIARGKPEAYCIYCQTCLRAHKSDLVSHAKSKKHKEAEKEAPADCRSYLESYMPDLEETMIGEAVQVTKEGSTSPDKIARGPSKQEILRKEAILEQIAGEMQDTNEKIQACEQELDKLKVKKSRLEYEFEHYSNS